MKKEEALALWKTVDTRDTTPIECVRNVEVSDFNIRGALHEGRHELGEGGWLSDNHHINLNERVDSDTYFIENHPTVNAISKYHYHRHKDYVIEFAVFTKQG